MPAPPRLRRATPAQYPAPRENASIIRIDAAASMSLGPIIPFLDAKASVQGLTAIRVRACLLSQNGSRSDIA